MNHRIGPPTIIFKAPEYQALAWRIFCPLCGEEQIWNNRREAARFMRYHISSDCEWPGPDEPWP